MAQRAVQEKDINIKLACAAFNISQTCYRYCAKLSSESSELGDRLVRVPANQRNWGFGLCFLYLRNVKGYGWTKMGDCPSIYKF
jgi:putative transposase